MIGTLNVNAHAFGEDLLSLVSSVLPISASCFYHVDNAAQIDFQALHGLSEPWQREYSRHFWQLDPLHPTRMHASSARVATLSPTMPHGDAQARVYYDMFLVPQNTVYQTELYFRSGGRIVAGASLLRDDGLGAMSADNLAFLERVVALVERTLAPVTDERLPEENIVTRGIDAFGLTRREAEIAQLIADGMCNKEICRRLDIGLPTVKTHVTRIFRKTGVLNRTGLMKKLYWGH